MNRLFEFRCPNGHVEERFVSSDLREAVCSCGEDSQRIVSAPRVKLEGISGSFPGAYDRWERVRAEKLAQERKKNASEGREYTPL